MKRKLRSAQFVSRRASRRRLWALLPGTMLSQAFRRLYVSSTSVPSWAAMTLIASAIARSTTRGSWSKSTSVSEHSPKKWPLTSISVRASPSCLTVALALSSTSISSGRVSGET